MTTTTMPAGYYNRFDATKNYERHLFRAGRVLQSAEPNEVESSLLNRVKSIADVLFHDGSIIKGCDIAVDPVTGVTTLNAGTIYLNGGIRGMAPATLTVPVVGVAVVGAFLNQVVITELDDPTLRDPAVGVQNTNLPGAARLQFTTTWGRAGDGTAGDFYPIYTIVDGVPLSQTPPPQIDAVSLAIASYDVESAGGFYVVSGLTLSQLADTLDGKQAYSLAEGVCRVSGTEVTIPHALRIAYAALPDLKTVLGEPHVAAGGTEIMTLNHSPVSSVDQVLINAQKTVTMQHGAFSGAVDVLPDSPILSLVAVNQGGTWNGTSFSGGTTFAQGTDYKLTSDSVDWSLPGAEPASGSTYQVVYRYVASVTPSASDASTVTVTGAVPGSVTQVSYKWKRPRIDRLCLDRTGTPVWVTGTPNDTSPLAPPVPGNLLPIASVRQTWTAARAVTNDGIRMMPMTAISSMQDQLNQAFQLIAQQSLQTSIAISDPVNKTGLYIDPLTDDTARDQGTAQTAAVYSGIMTLPIAGVTVSQVSLTAPATLPYNTAATAPVIQQTLKTMCMLVNPYQAFNPIPASASLAPATDYWTSMQTTWASPVTLEFETTKNLQWGWMPGTLTRYSGSSAQIVVDQTTQIVSTSTVAAAQLRPIDIKFTLTGFQPGESLNSVTFDSVPVIFGTGN